MRIINLLFACLFFGLAYSSTYAQVGLGGDDQHLDQPIGGASNQGASMLPPAPALDSTLTPRSTKKVYKAQYLDVTSKPPAISGARYDLLPTCPPAIINCPDLMGRGGSTNQCPDYCRQTRDPETLVVQPGTTRVISSPISPVCPVGYSQVDQYNMKNEAVYNAKPPAITPILGMDQYNKYVQAGYYCQPKGGVRISDEYCSGTYTDGQRVDTVNNAGGYVVQILNSYYDRCYVDFMGCQYGKGWGCGSGTNPLWKYRYYFVSCQPPSGLYLTGNLTPVSIVCARVKTTWKPISND